MIGRTLAHYQIVGPLGKGGMGEVYRARDTKLNREVALKLLPPDLAADPGRLARLRREAQLLASCHHPQIAAIHGLEEADGFTFLVLELVDGQTLQSRLREGRLPVERALDIARQVASALELAHQRGVVHRDLKAANVMLNDRDQVKVLDFGLAKTLGSAAATDADATAALTMPLTVDGSLLGTVPYMSPEQIRGEDVDHRTDIWAFGCLLYQLFAGRRAFAQKTPAETGAAILEREPDWTALDPRTPAAVRRLIRRCLRKDVHQRLQHIDDARIVLEEPDEETQTVSESRRGRFTGRLGWAVALIAAAIAAIALFARRESPPVAGSPLRFTVALPQDVTIARGEVFHSLALSPNGRHLAFTSNGLWLHSFADGTSRRMEGTDGASNPFWSPDSRSVGFVAAGEIRKISIEGGPAERIANTNLEGGITWGDHGVILNSQSGPGGRGIYAVSADGGEPEQVTHVDPEREFGHFWPQFLPGGERFLFLKLERAESGVTHSLCVGNVESGVVERVASLASRFQYVQPGWLLYASEGLLVARRFDAGSLRFEGPPVPLANELFYFLSTGLAQFSVSTGASPALACHGGPWSADLTWYDRSGQTTPFDTGRAFDHVRISPTGDRVLVDIMEPSSGGRDLWVYRTHDAAPRRLTLSTSDETAGTWFPDGERIVFRSDLQGPPDIFSLELEGTGQPEVVLHRDAVLQPTDVSPDAHELIYVVFSRTTGLDLWTLALDGNAPPQVFVETAQREWDGRYSPDGQWIAFVSDETGRPEVYIAPRESPGARRPVSLAGGIAPRWRGDGGELFFLGPQSTVMSARIEWDPQPRIATPVALFRAEHPVYRAAWDVMPDGERFLLNTVREDAGRRPIQVVMNWTALLQE